MRTSCLLTGPLLGLILTLVTGAQAAGEDMRPLSTYLGTLQRRFESRCDDYKVTRDVARRMVAGAHDDAARNADRPTLLATANRSIASAESLLDKAQAAVYMHCQCLPSELGTAAAPQGGMDSTAPATEAQARALFETVNTVCMARQVRSLLPADCRRGDPANVVVSDRALYCDCVSQAVTEAPDQLIADAERARLRNGLERDRPRQPGEPPAAADASFYEPFTAACQQKFRP